MKRPVQRMTGRLQAGAVIEIRPGAIANQHINWVMGRWTRLLPLQAARQQVRETGETNLPGVISRRVVYGPGVVMSAAQDT